jgi:hypothetical protein
MTEQAFLMFWKQQTPCPPNRKNALASAAGKVFPILFKMQRQVRIPNTFFIFFFSKQEKGIRNLITFAALFVPKSERAEGGQQTY